MDILLDPNVAYLLLVLGFILAILAILTPGTGLLEIGALFALLLAGWAVLNRPVNYWALGVLIVGVVPFFVAVRRSGQLVYLALSILALVVGSVYLFRGEGLRPAVHPALALIVSTLVVGLLWITTTKTLEALMSRPAHDLGSLVGEIGEAKTDIEEEGTVHVRGEDWTARSEKTSPAGASVRVVDRDGFILIVEPVE